MADLQRDLCILMVLSRNIGRRDFNKCCRKRQMKQKWIFFLLKQVYAMNIRHSEAGVWGSMEFEDLRVFLRIECFTD